MQFIAGGIGCKEILKCREYEFLDIYLLRQVAVLGVMEVVRLPRQMHQYLQSKHPQ